MTARKAGIVLAAGYLVVFVPALGAAQVFNVEQPLVISAGAPKGGARTVALDASRRGLATSRLPASRLQTEWRNSLGFVAQDGPLVDFRGNVYVVGENGEVTELSRDGAVLSRVTARSPQPGPAALLSDDTVVFVDAAGEAVAVHDGVVAWRSQFGRPSAEHGAPIALDDGGVVVASGPDLAILDRDGRERTRVVLPEATNHPLISVRGTVIAVGDTGTVWSWSPGSSRAVRISSFGSNIDESAALLDDRTLVAITETGTRLSTVDLLDGTSSKLAGASAGLWLGSPVVDGVSVCAIQTTAAGEIAVVIDRSGLTRGSALLWGHPQAHPSDQRAGPTERTPVTAPIVGNDGRLAFASANGSVGVVSGVVPSPDAGPSEGATVELLADACGPPAANASGARSAVVGLAPLPPNGLVAVCRSGLTVAIKATALSGGSKGARL